MSLHYKSFGRSFVLSLVSRFPGSCVQLAEKKQEKETYWAPEEPHFYTTEHERNWQFERRKKPWGRSGSIFDQSLKKSVCRCAWKVWIPLFSFMGRFNWYNTVASNMINETMFPYAIKGENIESRSWLFSRIIKRRKGSRNVSAYFRVGYTTRVFITREERTIKHTIK